MNPLSSRLNRRRFLRSAAAASGAMVLGGNVFGKAQKKPKRGDLSDIEHVVVVMMENRSFDHFLGWLPGANGRQAGLTYYDQSGLAHQTYPLAPDYQGCGHPDPDHSHEGGLVEFNNGACDGWLRAGQNDLYSIGYYTKADLPFLGQAASAWTTCDNYFAATLAETYPNRIYQHAAQTDRLINTLDISTLPTIWDRLLQRNVTGRYYFSDVPILALWDVKYVPISRPIGSFFDDCAAGTLPQVSYVDPAFLGEDSGTSADDHPHADIRNGEPFLNKIYEAVTSSPNWPETLLIFNFDEWGGFFDHVPPGRVPIPPADQAAGDHDGLRGFRVPAILVSPWSPRASVAHGIYDHTSILRLIEARWNLQPLTVRDASAVNLATALDFRRPNLAVPHFNVPPGPFGGPCPVPATAPNTAAATTAPNEQDAWATLRQMADSSGFPRPR